MKKLQFIAAIMAFLVFGCSEQNNPVGPAQSVAPGSPLAKGSTTGTTSLAPGDALVDNSIITTSARIAAKNGGSVGLKGAYTTTGGVFVSYDLGISFPGGALPKDTTISITIDKTTFQENGLITFGPCGLVFKSPGVLKMNCQGIAIAQGAASVRLYYLNNGVMEPMPDSWGSFTIKDPAKAELKAGANIPHFSRYAFGR